MQQPWQPLDGVRVLDFTRVLAGPFCTMLLGDMGADVVKVEGGAGDDTRQWGPPWAGDPDADDRLSAYYLAVNRNKRALTLDLKSPDGQRIARQLAARSHIVIENFKPGTMGRFGLDYDALSADNPALVYASITGYGQTGPYADRPGYDHIIQAMSGLMSITGPPDGDGYKVGVAVSDVITGLFTLSGVLAALRHAQATGQGRYLDIALLDAQLAALVNVASNALVGGLTPARYGNAHSNIVPYQNFHAADGSFALAVGNDGQFRALCAVIDRADLADDPRYATNPARTANRDSLVASLQRIFLDQSADAWVAALTARGVPAGRINTVSEALADPHALARGLLHTVGLANGATATLVGSPLTEGVRLPPPLPGQHTDAILSQLGYDAATIADWRGRDIIA